MASVTSLYLCNRTIQAAVGKAGGKRVKIKKLAAATLPEGCLINGVITNEAVLAAALDEFFTANALPRKRVRLVIDSTQIMTKVFAAPPLSQKKLFKVIGKEMAIGMETQDHPLVDYMPLEKTDKAATLLASAVEAAFVESYDALANSASFTIGCIDAALACELKLLRRLPCFAGKVSVVLNFDGDTLHALLLEDGRYKYSSRSRLFNTHGSPALGAEVAQTLSGTTQFQLSSKGQPVTDVFFAACTPEDLDACRPGCDQLGLRVEPLPDAPKTAALPGEGLRLADCIYTVGNLIGK